MSDATSTMTTDEPTLRDRLLALEPLLSAVRINQAKVVHDYAALVTLGRELWEAGGEAVADPSTIEHRMIPDEVGRKEVLTLWVRFAVSGVPNDTPPSWRGLRYAKGHELAHGWDGHAPSMGVLRDDEVTEEQKRNRELGERILVAMYAWKHASEVAGLAYETAHKAMMKLLDNHTSGSPTP